MENPFIKYEGLDYNPRCTAEQFFQLEHTPVYAVFESEECYFDFMFTAERFGITWAGSGMRAASYDPGYNGGICILSAEELDLSIAKSLQ